MDGYRAARSASLIVGRGPSPGVHPATTGSVAGTGLPAALTMAGLLTLFQQSTTDSYRGRVFAAAEGIAVLAGTLAGGYLTQPFGIIPVIAIQGAGYLIAGLLMTAWLRDRVAAAHSPTRWLPAGRFRWPHSNDKTRRSR
jgi:hypothetical protein